MPSTLPPRQTPAHATLGTAMEHLRHRWGWFVALGVLAVLLGVVALGLVIHATITTVYIIAIFMIVAGGSEITMGLGARTWGRSVLYVAAGLFYIVAAAFALAQPINAAIVFTLLLGSAMLAAGLIRIYIGTHMHSHARTMVIVGGAVTSLVGLFIILGWPTNSIVILGTLLGVDLLVTGFMWVGFGLRLRSHA
jgi:uncharacterized membrane protein HdeD (DUF308 family)